MIGYYNVSVILTYIGLLSSLFGMANLSVARSGNPVGDQNRVFMSSLFRLLRYVRR